MKIFLKRILKFLALLIILISVLSVTGTFYWTHGNLPIGARLPGGLVLHNGTPLIVEHEQCHDKRIRAYPEGEFGFYLKYLTDRKFACQEELACGASQEHFACDN